MTILRRTPHLLMAVLLLCVAAGSTATAHAQSDLDSTVARALELTNIEREKNGLAPLAHNSELSQAAQAYSVVLATSGCFAHTCGPVPEMAERLRAAGYTGWTAIAENIAAGYPTPEAVVQGWMSSPGHRANLLSPRFTEIGIGLAQGGGVYGTFWTQNFGTRPGSPLPPMPEPMPEPEPDVMTEPAREEWVVEPVALPGSDPEPESLQLGLASV